MRTLNLRIIGTTPLLLHHISKHQLRDQIAAQGALSAEEEAKRVMEKDQDGNPAVPVSWLWDALRVGCSRITVDKKQISSIKLQSALQFQGDSFALQNESSGPLLMEVFKSMQHANADPSSRKSIVVIAPMFKKWSLAVTATIDESFDDNLVMLILKQAGRAGIGLFHPPKKQFGQFRIVRI